MRKLSILLALGLGFPACVHAFPPVYSKDFLRASLEVQRDALNMTIGSCKKALGKSSNLNISTRKSIEDAELTAESVELQLDSIIVKLGGKSTHPSPVTPLHKGV